MSPFCNLTSLSSVDIKIETNSPFCEICQLALAGIREIKIVEDHFRNICDICERQKILISFRKMKLLLNYFNTFPLDWQGFSVYLYYDFINESVDYLNFKVKLTIGIRTDNKHIQYCVNKIEVKEKKSTVPSVTN